MELFKPINGTCPFCNGPVNVIEGMVYDYTCDKNGYPNNLNQEQYRVTAYCKKCNKQLYAIPNNFGSGYSIYPVNILTSPFSYNNNSSMKRISVLAETFLENCEVNPFTNIENGYYEQNISNVSLPSVLESEDIPF